MFMTRQWRIRLTWLACAAMLLAALMPTLTRMLDARAPNQLFAELCSASGKTWVMQEPDSSGKAAKHRDDCGYCRLQSDTPVLPMAVFAVQLAGAATHRPPLFYTSPAPLFSWIASQPRGPPLQA